MNKRRLNIRFLIIFAALLFLLWVKEKSAFAFLYPKAAITLPALPNPGTKQVLVDVKKSNIKWKGTKLHYTGKHEGTVPVKEGKLYFTGEKLTGGIITVNMLGLQVTDIPTHETTARRNLTNHLHHDFNTKAYPTALFKITKVDYKTSSLALLQGNLTIKQITKPISVTSYITRFGSTSFYFSSQLTINRFDWDIGKDGSWLEKKLVDKEITLQIEIFTI